MKYREAVYADGVDNASLTVRALKGDRGAVKLLAVRLRFSDDVDDLSALQELAEQMQDPEFIGAAVATLFDAWDAEGLRKWAPVSAYARERLEVIEANLEREPEVRSKAAEGDPVAVAEWAVGLGMRGDVQTLCDLALTGNVVAVDVTADLLSQLEDMDTLRQMAQTGIAKFVDAYARVGDTDEVERLARMGNVTAFRYRCADLIDSGDMDRLCIFVSSVPGLGMSVDKYVPSKPKTQEVRQHRAKIS